MDNMEVVANGLIIQNDRVLPAPVAGKLSRWAA